MNHFTASINHLDSVGHRIRILFRFLLFVLLITSLLSGCSLFGYQKRWEVQPEYLELAAQVEIRRTHYGVPHIQGENLQALAFGTAWCQLEDYGVRIAAGLARARGETARMFSDRNNLEQDLSRKPVYMRAVETYHLLSQDVRDILEGFADGVNYYMVTNRKEFRDWPEPDFNGHDVAALTIGGPNMGLARRFIRTLDAGSDTADVITENSTDNGPMTYPADSNDGSNTWAFAPSRTTSGNAILMRNPHLSWASGYYEVHLSVPGILNFYGDIRIGGFFSIIGGFNEHLGWSTTNNSPDLDEIYELDLDPQNRDHYLFDGSSIPLRREEITVGYQSKDGIGESETREFWHTTIGPVIHQTDSKIYVMRSANDGEYRRGEQFLRMMRATDFSQWQDAMKMRAISSSNYTYADKDGNIFYVWNAKLPILPHEAKGEEAVPASRSSDIWTSLLPFEDLPQLLNPEGGYLQNSNDPPFYTNLNQILDADSYPPSIREPVLRLRSQHSLQLIHSEQLLSLEDVVELKHSMRMLMADRLKDDLVRTVRQSDPNPEISRAIELVADWDNTVSAESRGSVLFERWYSRLTRLIREEIQSREGPDARTRTDEDIFVQMWDPQDPINTPTGLARTDLAVEAFIQAMEESAERWGSWDVSWGDIHRVRIGDVDVPVGGGSSSMGCFRVLSFRRDSDGKLVANSGDGWVLVVEFGETPRAYSILAYGQSNDEDSPHYSDQAAMFAGNRMKPVAFTEEQIEAQLLYSYHPGGRKQKKR